MNLKRSNLTVQSLLHQARQAPSRESLFSLLAEAMLTYEIHHEAKIASFTRLPSSDTPTD